MKNLLLSSLLALLALPLAAQRADIIPRPRTMTLTGGTYSVVDVERLIDSYQAVPADPDCGLPAEGYVLDITPDGISITASTETGAGYACVTLLQLLMQNQVENRAVLPCLHIEDSPAFEHRGLMLDISRHFFGMDEVKRLLDVAHFYKINRFHWHLTDDQGWRIEIPEYPRLTEVGAVRDSSLTNKGRQPFFYDDTQYGEGCFYTLDELREVVDYAAALGIEVIPEVDLPGHMVAAVAAYPEFGCNPQRQVKVRVHQGVSKEVLNVGDDRVIDFLKCVLGHICDVFPSRYIHLGGDECPTDEWKDNPLCLQRVTDKGLKGVDELQSWLVEELGTWLKDEYGKDLIVWDELLAHWSDSNRIHPVIMCWRGLDYTAQAAARGFECISVPNYPMYLDLIQTTPEGADVCEVYQGGYGPRDVNTVEGIYRMNPVAKMAGKESLCLGTQGNLWTESCSSDEQAEYQILPRLLAVAENGWLTEGEKDFDGFRQRLQSHAALLDVMGYTYARHYFDPPAMSAEDSARVLAAAVLEAGEPGEIGYPSAKAFKKLRAGLARGKAAVALEWFAKQPVGQPVPGQSYRIRSASEWYLAKYAGSALYAKAGEGLHLHYTPQENETEYWLCEAAGDGRFTFVNEGDPSVRIEGVRVEKAVQGVPGYPYVPGTVLLRRADGRVLEANSSGCVFFGTDELLCHPGTWLITGAPL
ncbi:MAG: beta-N-acetylhexosaminidase [Bacteroidaceae bacterium]|nr:beta-N-acetylhexosaminidase [Bacteroidaceae bacterium]